MYNRIRKTMFVIVMILTVCVIAGPAMAKTNKVKPKKYTRITAYAERAALKVKKGEVDLKIGSSKNPCGYLVFTAPKKGRYSFTFSELCPVTVKKDADREQIGHVSFMAYAGDGFISECTAYVRGDYVDTMYLATWEARALMKKKGTITSESYLPERTGKMWMLKGQKVYLYCTFTSQMKAHLSIKKIG